MDVMLTRSCINEIHRRSKLASTPPMLRLAVEGGEGCGGFTYAFQFVEQRSADDHEVTVDGATLLLDDASLEMVSGSTIDYKDELVSSSFRVEENPQAESTCGCGASFSPKF